MSPVVGIFVGGASTRMGSDKALLRAPSGERLVERGIALARTIGAEAVLVGRVPGLPDLDVAVLDDAEQGSGPLGGLVALLTHAGQREAFVLGCDMPYVEAALLARLASAPRAIATAPRRDGRWEPLFSRLDAARALPLATQRLARRELGLQGLYDALPAVELSLDEAEAAQLDDWDVPADLQRVR